jgi:hypothetical protein
MSKTGTSTKKPVKRAGRTGAARTRGRKAAPKKTTGARKAGARRPAVRRPAARKSNARKPAARKTAPSRRAAGKRATAKRTTGKRATGKRTTAKRTTAKRAIGKRTTGKRATGNPPASPTPSTRARGAAKSGASRKAAVPKRAIRKPAAPRTRVRKRVGGRPGARRPAPRRAPAAKKAALGKKAARGPAAAAARKKVEALLQAPHLRKVGGRDRRKSPAVKPPFEAYRGSKPYIFASYAHEDMREVFGLIRKLNSARYRLWYDEGIEPGNEWPEVVGKAVLCCSQFMVFMSPAAIESRNVRNEINLASADGKSILVIYLKATDLSEGMRLQIGAVQNLNRYDMTEPEFLDKLRKVLATELRS